MVGWFASLPAHTVELPDCPIAIDFLYHDPTGVMTLQQFSHDRSVPHAFQIPFAWQHGRCQVLLTSGGQLAVDTFRLADVVVKALRIMDECPPKSKKGLGGLALVGNGKTMFVVVNGPDLAPDGVGEGEEGEVEMGGSGEDGDGVAVLDPDLTSEGLMTS
ncbi:MAG: hypothetical protein ASARMPREDX12_000435 [Alectoria sarmentosa]|nr:MAG: hypothetical protein ASARMPREDX12_000435 [Alectoria sarmentosa]